MQVPADCKLFIGGLAPHADQSKIAAYLASYGQVAHLNIRLNSKNECMGFGHVQMAESSVAQQILRSGPHRINGALVDIKPYVRAEDSHKIFVGGLSVKTDNEGLINYFSRFGTVSEGSIRCELGTGRPRGFGFVTFEDPATVEVVVGKAGHVIDDRAVDVKRLEKHASGNPANERRNPPPHLQQRRDRSSGGDRRDDRGRDSQSSDFWGSRRDSGGGPPPRRRDLSRSVVTRIYPNNNTGPAAQRAGSSNHFDHENKLFIGGLTPSTTEQGLRIYFSQFGKIKDVNVAIDKVTGKMRGFGFIQFADAAGVDKCMSLRPHVIGGALVEVKRSLPNQDPKNMFTVTKLYVGGIKPEHDKPVLTEYFSEFGRVLNVLIADRRTLPEGQRPHAFVMFDDYDAVDRVIARGNGHMIGGVPIDCHKGLNKEELTRLDSQLARDRAARDQRSGIDGPFDPPHPGFPQIAGAGPRWNYYDAYGGGPNGPAPVQPSPPPHPEAPSIDNPHQTFPIKNEPGTESNPPDNYFQRGPGANNLLNQAESFPNQWGPSHGTTDDARRDEHPPGPVPPPTSTVNGNGVGPHGVPPPNNAAPIGGYTQQQRMPLPVPTLPQGGGSGFDRGGPPFGGPDAGPSSSVASAPNSLAGTTLLKTPQSRPLLQLPGPPQLFHPQFPHQQQQQQPQPLAPQPPQQVPLQPQHNVPQHHPSSFPQFPQYQQQPTVSQPQPIPVLQPGHQQQQQQQKQDQQQQMTMQHFQVAQQPTQLPMMSQPQPGSAIQQQLQQGYQLQTYSAPGSVSIAAPVSVQQSAPPTMAIPTMQPGSGIPGHPHPSFPSGLDPASLGQQSGSTMSVSKLTVVNQQMTIAPAPIAPGQPHAGALPPQQQHNMQLQHLPPPPPSSQPTAEQQMGAQQVQPQPQQPSAAAATPSTTAALVPTSSTSMAPSATLPASALAFFQPPHSLTGEVFRQVLQTAQVTPAGIKVLADEDLLDSSVLMALTPAQFDSLPISMGDKKRIEIAFKALLTA